MSQALPSVGQNIPACAVRERGRGWRGPGRAGTGSTPGTGGRQPAWPCPRSSHHRRWFRPGAPAGSAL